MDVSCDINWISWADPTLSADGTVKSEASSRLTHLNTSQLTHTPAVHHTINNRCILHSHYLGCSFTLSVILHTLSTDEVSASGLEWSHPDNNPLNERMASMEELEIM